MKALVLVLLAGCSTHQVFVRSIVIRGNEILVEKCAIEYRGDAARSTNQCTQETLLIPTTTAPVAAPAPSAPTGPRP